MEAKVVELKEEKKADEEKLEAAWREQRHMLIKEAAANASSARIFYQALVSAHACACQLLRGYLTTV